MSAAPSRPGRPTLIFRSMRPGRRTAGSIRSGRLEARIMTTSRSESTPSNSAQNMGTKVLEMLKDRMARRVPRIDSASSIKTNGSTPSLRRARAWAKRSRTIRSDSPNHMFRISGPFTCRNDPRVTLGRSGDSTPASWSCLARLDAVAWPMRVLPQPGGPCSKKPFGWVN